MLIFAYVLYSVIETKAQLLVSLDLFPAVCPVASAVPPSGMIVFLGKIEARTSAYVQILLRASTS